MLTACCCSPSAQSVAHTEASVYGRHRPQRADQHRGAGNGTWVIPRDDGDDHADGHDAQADEYRVEP
jgi:hypothetical protein